MITLLQSICTSALTCSSQKIIRGSIIFPSRTQRSSVIISLSLKSRQFLNWYNFGRLSCVLFILYEEITVPSCISWYSWSDAGLIFLKIFQRFQDEMNCLQLNITYIRPKWLKPLHLLLSNAIIPWETSKRVENDSILRQSNWKKTGVTWLGGDWYEMRSSGPCLPLCLPLQGGKTFCACFIAGSRREGRAFLLLFCVLTVFDSLFVCHWESSD